MSKARFHARILAGPMVICCLALPWDDPFVQYFERKDGVFVGGGNAKSANSAIHMIDPWPRNVGNRRIPGDGQRMSGAVERYRDVTKLPLAAPPIATEYGVTTNIQSANTTAK
jgi:hypothetical protein